MIKKYLMIGSLAAAGLVAAQDVSAIKNTVEAYSNSSLNGSAKYNAMAGSMGALGGDFSVLNSNPAGIGVSITSEFSGTLFIESNKNNTAYAGKSISYTTRNTDLGNIGGIAAFNLGNASKWKFVNVAVNYSSRSLEDYSESPGDASLVYDIRDNNVLVDQLAFSGHAYNRIGRLSKMSFGVGANYDHRIYLGAGLNFHNADIDQFDTAAFTDKTGALDFYNKQYTPFSESSTGFSATVGVIGKINPQFRLGAAIETPTWWGIARAYNSYDNPIDGTYSEDRNLTTPMKATVSAAFVPSKNFAVNVDYSLGLTKAKYKVHGAAEQELNNFFSQKEQNLSEVKVGAEYRYEGFRLRGGYGYASNPFDAITVRTLVGSGSIANQNFDNLYMGSRNTLGVGLGYDFKSFYVDAAYQNVQSEYTSSFLQGFASSNTGYFSNNYIVESDAAAVAKVKNTKSNFFVTLGWKF